MLALPGAPTDDPGLVLAGARRLARDGQVEKALEAYREAERLLDDPGFGRRCAAERQAVGVWLPQSATSALPPVPPGADAESALLRLSIELRRLTRDVRRPESYDRDWLRGLAYLLSGDLATAERLLAVRVDTRPGRRSAGRPGGRAGRLPGAGGPGRRGSPGRPDRDDHLDGGDGRLAVARAARPVSADGGAAGCRGGGRAGRGGRRPADVAGARQRPVVAAGRGGRRRDHRPAGRCRVAGRRRERRRSPG